MYDIQGLSENFEKICLQWVIVSFLTILSTFLRDYNIFRQIMNTHINEYNKKCEIYLRQLEAFNSSENFTHLLEVDIFSLCLNLKGVGIQILPSLLSRYRLGDISMS